MPFAESFKRLRRSRGLTQSKLAEELGLSKSAVSMYECGNREPELDVLIRIADYFGVDMNELTGCEKLVNDDPELTEFLDCLRSRSELRMLFSVTKNATREDVEKAVKIIEALRSTN